MIPFQRVNLPPGMHAIERTVDLMARAAMGKWGAHSPRIRTLAIDIIRRAGVREKDKLGEVDAIHQWVMQHLRYVNDPLWQEFITYPETLAFDQKDGDCDDHAVLEAALLGAIGIRTRFVTVAPKPGPMSHVYLQANVTSDDGTGTGARVARWIDLDPIMKDQPMGWAVPNPYARTIFPLNSPKGIGLQSTGGLLATLAGIAASLGIIK